MNEPEMIPPIEARLQEAEEQCRHERTKRIELAALVGQFVQRAVPLINDAGLYLDAKEFERVVKPSSTNMKSAVAEMTSVPADTARVIFGQSWGTTWSCPDLADRFDCLS